MRGRRAARLAHFDAMASEKRPPFRVSAPLQHFLQLFRRPLSHKQPKTFQTAGTRTVIQVGFLRGRDNKMKIARKNLPVWQIQSLLLCTAIQASWMTMMTACHVTADEKVGGRGGGIACLAPGGTAFSHTNQGFNAKCITKTTK